MIPLGPMGDYLPNIVAYIITLTLSWRKILRSNFQKVAEWIEKHEKTLQEKIRFFKEWSISLSDFTQIEFFFLGVTRILKSFISMEIKMWESCLWLRNIELVVAYIRWLVPGGPYLTSYRTLQWIPKANLEGHRTFAVAWASMSVHDRAVDAFAMRPYWLPCICCVITVHVRASCWYV